MLHSKKYLAIATLIGLMSISAIITPSYADRGNPRLKDIAAKKWAEQNLQDQDENATNSSKEGFYVRGKGKSHQETLGDRTYIVYTPPAASLPRTGNIPLLIVLHGGFGRAAQIQHYIGLDPLADKYGFIIAYLDGTPVARRLSAKREGWNAGGCCGQPETNNVDDVGFIRSSIAAIHEKYGIDPAQVYGTGHSNGGMMTQRILCETTLYKEGVSISGTLQMERKTCPAAKGKHIVDIHGAQDENLPVAGGHGPKAINKKTDYKSQAHTKAVFEASGATYQLILLDGATHKPETINAALIKTKGKTLPQEIIDVLGLD